MRIQAPQSATMKIRLVVWLIAFAVLLAMYWLTRMRAIAAEGDPTLEPENPVLTWTIRLHAGGDGSLETVKFGNAPLGAGQDGLDELNRRLYELVGKTPVEQRKGLTVTLIADDRLQYVWVVKTMAACQNWKDPQTGSKELLIGNVRLQVAE